MRRHLVPLCLVAVAACEPLPSVEPPDTTPLGVGASRTIELRDTSFDVRRFEKTLTYRDLFKLPIPLRESMWLMDLPLAGTPSEPGLFDHALDDIIARDPSDPSLSVAEQRLVRLLNMTPDTADLAGTSLEPLLALGETIGLAPAAILAEAMGIASTERFLSSDTVRVAMIDALISTHPAAQTRPGSGVPVAPGSLPVTLEDALSDMATLAKRFGPSHVPGEFHPGFLVGDTRAELLTDDFAMTVRADLNALPYSGVDLHTGARAAVNSIGWGDTPIFDTDASDWLSVVGLNPSGPRVQSMTFALREATARLVPGTAQSPWPTGNSAVWMEAPWTLERIVAEAALSRWGQLDQVLDYRLGESDEPAARVTISDGWFSAETVANLGEPPPPTYLWDLLVDVVEHQLHAPLPGSTEPPPAAPIELHFSLTDLPVGLDNDDVVRLLKDNLAADPTNLVAAARYLFDNSSGEADIYYRRAPEGVAPEAAGDWLLFVAPDDIPLAASGEPVRDPNAYEHVGFFVDDGLTERIGGISYGLNDGQRHKVRVEVGDTVFVGDDGGRVFRVDISAKPSRARLGLTITRVR